MTDGANAVLENAVSVMDSAMDIADMAIDNAGKLNKTLISWNQDSTLFGHICSGYRES